MVGWLSVTICLSNLCKQLHDAVRPATARLLRSATQPIDHFGRFITCRQSQDADRPATAAAAEVLAGLLAVPASYAPGLSAPLSHSERRPVAADCLCILRIQSMQLVPQDSSATVQRSCPNCGTAALPWPSTHPPTHTHRFCTGGAWSEWLAPALRQALAGAPLGERLSTTVLPA